MGGYARRNFGLLQRNGECLRPLRRYLNKVITWSAGAQHWDTTSTNAGYAPGCHHTSLPVLAFARRHATTRVRPLKILLIVVRAQLTDTAVSTSSGLPQNSCRPPALHPAHSSSHPAHHRHTRRSTQHSTQLNTRRSTQHSTQLNSTNSRLNIRHHTRHSTTYVYLSFVTFNQLNINPQQINFSGSDSYHEIHEILYTTKFNTRTVC